MNITTSRFTRQASLILHIKIMLLTTSTKRSLDGVHNADDVSGGDVIITDSEREKISVVLTTLDDVRGF